MYAENKSKFYLTDISLLELISYMWSKKIYIIFSTTFFLILSFFYLNFTPNIYQSSSIVLTVDAERSLSLGGLDRFASLGGIGLSSSGNSTKKDEIFEKLNSFDFFKTFNNKHNILPELLASKSFDLSTNQIIYDSSIYSKERKIWIDPSSQSTDYKPSLYLAYLKFQKSFNIYHDDKNGFFYISINHISPNTSKKWLEDYIALLNDEMRRKDIESSSNALIYLNRKLEEAKLSEVRTSLSDLIKKETEILMLAEAEIQYAIKYIEPPYLTEIPLYPKKLFVILLFGIIGFLIGAFAVSLVLFKSLIR